MNDSPCPSHHGLATRPTSKREIVTPPTPRRNQVFDLHAFKEAPFHQNFSNLVFLKPRPKRQPLPVFLHLEPTYGFAGSLKTLAVGDGQDAPYEVVRLGRFPQSRFSIQELGEKSRRFELVSNLWGSQYDLLEDHQTLATISFEVGLCGESACRQAQIHYLVGSPESLVRPGKELDLAGLSALPENKDKIACLHTDQPWQSPAGDFAMTFATRGVVPAVENAVLVDGRGRQQMELVRVAQGFAVVRAEGMAGEVAVAFALASLDFKWALE